MVGGQWIDLGMGLGGGWWVVGGGLVVLGLGFSGGCFREREREERKRWVSLYYFNRLYLKIRNGI